MHEFRRLARGVYAYLQPPLIWYSSAGVIVGDRDVIVVDSLSNARTTESLKAEIRGVTDLPVRFLVNTHSHADHVYTNHLFPEATVISSHRGREKTREFQQVQESHDATFRRLFPEVDFEGGRYTPQDLSFGGTLTLYQGEREIRLLELGPGHSESDVVVYLPQEKIVFCGDLFVGSLPPMPGEGHVSQAIASYRALEDLGADIYVAGHGDPGSLADVRSQRLMLESEFQQAWECFEKGIPFDEVLGAPSHAGMSLDFRRLIVLSSYCEFAGQAPDTHDPDSHDHLAILRAMAAEARATLERDGAGP